MDNISCVYVYVFMENSFPGQDLDFSFLLSTCTDTRVYRASSYRKHCFSRLTLTPEKVSLAISALKINRCAGFHGISAEFVKACKQSLNESITMISNYVIESRDLPDTWAGGLRSAVFKTRKAKYC